MLFICLFLIFSFSLNYNAEGRITSIGALRNIQSINKSLHDDAVIRNKKLILMWTPVKDDWVYPSLATMPSTDCYADRCVVAYNYNSLLSRADAVVFHAPNINDFLLKELPVIPDKIKVFFAQEAMNSIESYANANMKLPKNYFHWTMTFHSKSDVPFPYGGYFIRPEEAKEKGYPSLKLPYDNETIFKNKKIKGALWFSSDCRSFNNREGAVEALAKYMRIDHGGACGNKNLCPRTKENYAPLCEDLKSEYYFYLALENSVCDEYITEKYWNHYKLPVILIVMRRGIYENLVPPNFIAMDDFSGPKEMAEYLNHLMENPDEYLKYFEWRSKGWALAPLNREGYRMGMCRLCDKLWENASIPEPIPDVIQWYNRTLDCSDGVAFVKNWIREKYK